ncbi:hypothetical protein JCM14076_08750 [Methylosoma difficile]
MSMNIFFRAFTQPEIEAMMNDNHLIDQWVLEENKYSLNTDVETAWDVLAAILDGVGFWIGVEVDNALFNGCNLISAAEVQTTAAKLAEWTHEQVMEGLRGLSDDADLYHFEVFQDDDEYLLEQFDCLQSFYKEAAEKGLGALSYAA